MRDKIALLLAGKQIDNFLSYSIEADIYVADDAFSLELANPGIAIKEGARCELHVNGKLELTGIIDKVTKSYNKDGVKLKLEGRDLMGLLVDSYCEEFKAIGGMTLKTLAEFLLKKIPFINRSAVTYQRNIKGGLKSHKKKAGGDILHLFDTPQKVAQIEAGMTVFETLKEYSHSRGLMFFAAPDGTFTFGVPKIGGDPAFHLVVRKSDGSQNNSIEGELVRDISKRYSKVTVIGQQQGGDAITPEKINTKETILDPTFPFYKPYVAKNNNDYQSPKLHGRMLLEKMRHEGFQLSYKVPGHAQGDRNWTINELCRVTDEILEVDGVYLIYGRKFELSKERGIITSLKLGPPGVLQ